MKYDWATGAGHGVGGAGLVEKLLKCTQLASPSLSVGAEPRHWTLLRSYRSAHAAPTANRKFYGLKEAVAPFLRCSRNASCLHPPHTPPATPRTGHAIRDKTRAGTRTHARTHAHTRIGARPCAPAGPSRGPYQVRVPCPSPPIPPPPTTEGGPRPTSRRSPKRRRRAAGGGLCGGVAELNVCDLNNICPLMQSGHRC